MKKLFIIVAVSGLVLSFSSCSKEYTCECSVTDSNGTVVSTTSFTKEYDSKSDAEKSCNTTVQSGSQKTECKIK